MPCSSPLFWHRCKRSRHWIIPRSGLIMFLTLVLFLHACVGFGSLYQQCGSPKRRTRRNKTNTRPRSKPIQMSIS
jgi:hypothetical protein